MRTWPETTRMTKPESRRESQRHAHTAVILANHLDVGGESSAMPWVGALPMALRSILGAQKAGATRIVVVIDEAKSPLVKSELLQTGRISEIVEWCEISYDQVSLPSALGQIASRFEGHLVLIAGDRIFHPSLHQRAAQSDGEASTSMLMTGEEMVGICSLSRETTIDLARRCPAIASSIEDIHAWLAITRPVTSEAVPKDKWQRILNEQQRVLAERKLDSWLVKPTDGIFARTNRKISIPISRQIIPFPITPNMVSLFTLAVSLAAGVCFALGGYWNMLTGAVLSWLSSVLDGCDGEVARLKLQESAFGCWLETMCDNLYYLFIFAGMTIGLVRSTGNRFYLVWGGLLLFGAIMSFIMTGLQRYQLASGSPEQYLREWQRKADSRSSNPFLYLGRHTEFIIRRCFLPYLILFVAMLNIVGWLVVGAALGANLVWMITLYSYLTFAPSRSVTSPIVS